MPKPLRKLIEEIDNQKKFDECRVDEVSLDKQIDMIFGVFNVHKNQIAARVIYSGIADLARLGKRDLADKYVSRFEKEVGYDFL
ncbi:MAG: hypothetical protein ACUZ8O_02350 [Candidatus Anammoxibacter sp.]